MKSNPVHDDIKSYIVQRGFTLTEVVNAINNNRPESEQTTIQNLSNKLARGSIKYSEVLEIASIIGLKITWNP